MTSAGSILRQSSCGKQASRRWVGGFGSLNKYYHSGGGCESNLMGMESYGFDFDEFNNGGDDDNGLRSMVRMKRRIMVLVDQTSCSKHAMMWALTHVANQGDLLTLVHVVSPNQHAHHSASTPHFANSLASLCKACKPEVEVEALVIQGPKLGTVISQVKKLEVSVLVLGQKKSSPLINCFCGTSSSDEFVEQCINSCSECLTIGVRKQRKGVSGYLINSRWQKNFWLLA